MSFDVFDDLLGDAQPARAPLPAAAPEEMEVSLRRGNIHEVVGGVTVQWLSTVFRMSKPKVVQRLIRCPTLKTHQNGAVIYDLAAAAAYLVPPKTDVKAYLRGLKPDDLPEQLKDQFWAAKLKEQRWRTNAGELWTSDSVMEVFGETFKTIKQTVQLWTDSVEETVGVTDEQRIFLRNLSDDLLDKIHKALVTLDATSATRNQLSELDADVE